MATTCATLKSRKWIDLRKFNAKASRRAILQAMRDLAGKLKPDDSLLVYLCRSWEIG
ncbi:MAG: hypothetical protein HY360_27125 [Verrucomicrobia bacterium]|nr:hypothetical protein [Verrucomicrobiota bacterium]